MPYHFHVNLRALRSDFNGQSRSHSNLFSAPKFWSPGKGDTRRPSHPRKGRGGEVLLEPTRADVRGNGRMRRRRRGLRRERHAHARPRRGALLRSLGAFCGTPSSATRGHTTSGRILRDKARAHYRSLAKRAELSAEAQTNRSKSLQIALLSACQFTALGKGSCCHSAKGCNITQMPQEALSGTRLFCQVRHWALFSARGRPARPLG